MAPRIPAKTTTEGDGKMMWEISAHEDPARANWRVFQRFWLPKVSWPCSWFTFDPQPCIQPQIGSIRVDGQRYRTFPWKLNKMLKVTDSPPFCGCFDFVSGLIVVSARWKWQLNLSSIILSLDITAFVRVIVPSPWQQCCCHDDPSPPEPWRAGWGCRVGSVELPRGPGSLR